MAAGGGATFDEGEGLDQGALEALQLTRLQEAIGRACRSALYRDKCAAAGVSPQALKAPSDLSRFPFTTKDDLRAAYPFGAFVAPMAEIARIHASSGTTGVPTIVGSTRRDLEIWAGLMARSLHAAGARPGMKAHNAYGYGLFTGGLGAHAGAEALDLTVIPVSGGQTERQVRLICDLRPEIILATPSFMLAILDEFTRQGRDPRATALRIGVFGAEPWTAEMRDEIEQAFGIDALDIYGLSEVMGPGVAAECRDSRGGLTLWEDHFYPEIIDPATGAPLPDGETGELVLTTLTREAMPLIRYRTRDLTRLLPGGVRAHRRLERFSGRSDDMLIIRGVNLFPAQIESLVLGVAELAPHYEIEVTRPERLDRLEIIVEARPRCSPETRAAAAGALARSVKDTIGVSAEVRVVEPGTLARSAGKAARVRDLRANPAR